MPRFSFRNEMKCPRMCGGSKDIQPAFIGREGKRGKAGWQASEVRTYDPHDRNEEIALRQRERERVRRKEERERR